MEFSNKPNKSIEYRNGTFPKTAIFIPCSKEKRCIDNPANQYSTAAVNLMQIDLPNQWQHLIGGRRAMNPCIFQCPQTVPAINLYNGHFYRSVDFNWGGILNMVKAGWLRIYVISACYGIIDIRESIQDYDAVMNRCNRLRCRYRLPCKCGATLWNHNKLEDVICDLLGILQPERIFGYFSGNTTWAGPGAKYRYFFNEGLDRALGAGLNPKCAGCFFNQNGRGIGPIYNGLAEVFVQHSGSNFDCNFGPNLINHPFTRGNVMISYDQIV